MTTGPLLGAVVVASNRAAAGVYEDATGPLLVEFLTRLGFATGAPAVVPDGRSEQAHAADLGRRRNVHGDARVHGLRPR